MAADQHDGDHRDGAHPNVDQNSVEQQLLARADELMVNAPGRVVVARISHIDDVRVLRAAREVETDQDRERLAQLRLLVMERLDGVLALAGPAKAERKPGLLDSLLAPFRGAADNMTTAMQSQGRLGDFARESGIPTRLPAPADLLDAAEYWVLSHLVADRVEGNLALLRKPWLEATVEPI